MLHIGCHLSSAKGFEAMGKEALKIGADTFQFFTRNPRGGAAKALDTEDASRLQALLETNSFAPLVAHAPYTLNPCAASEDLRQFAQQTMADDLARLEHLPGNYYNFHPGSHVKQGAEAGIARIAEVLDRVLWPECQTTVLLETMAGKGTEVGRSFEELRASSTTWMAFWNSLTGCWASGGCGRSISMTARTPLAATKTAMRPLATAPSVWKPWNGSSTIPSSSTCPFAWRRPMT